MSNKVKGSVCMMFSAISIMTQETNTATQKEVQTGDGVTQSEKSESKATITVTPTNWNVIDSTIGLN